MAREIRLDRGRLANAKRTPQGFVRVDGRLTRTGILEYARADGTIQRELRPDEEVFHTDSLASLDGAPVTDLHPSSMVDATNVQALARGHVRAAKRDGRFVTAELTVQAGDLIQKIDAGERQEISCGYSCEYDPTPGVWQGQRYDGVQRKIEYNHVAIGPRDWGRAGAEVSLRLDSTETVAPVLVSRFDQDELAQDNPVVDTSKDSKHMSLKINGVEIKLDAAEAKLVQDELDARAAAVTAAEKNYADMQVASSVQAGELVALKARCDAAEGKLSAQARSALEQEVRPVLGAEFKCDGKSDTEIKAAVVAKLLPSVRCDSTDAAFVQGAYVSAMSLASKAAEEQVAAARQSRSDNSEERNDNDPSKAREEMIARRRAAAFTK